MTKTGAVLGTPAYMSPEQAVGDTSTRKSDLYSLGATLYQLATGSLPYTGSPARVLAAIAAGSAVPAVRRRASVGAELSRVIDRLMAVDPSARPVDAATVASQLRAIAAAGDFGDATDELAAYLADPDGFVRARTPVVVGALVRAAHAAIGEAKLPRAMALADRASALAPDDPAVAALVSKVTEGGRASSRRRGIALAAAGVVALGGAGLGVRALLAGRGAVAAADAAALIVAAPDAASAQLPDAAVALVSMPVADAAIDAAAPRARADARVAHDAAIALAPDAAPPTLDASVAAIDAPAPTPAPPADGAIVVTNDTWCNLFLDDVAAGRFQPPHATLVAHPGHHVVRCEQRDQHRAWSRDVDVPAGGTTSAGGTLLDLIAVAVGTRADVRIDGKPAARGTIVHLAHGAHRIEGANNSVANLSIATDCTLVDPLDDRGAVTLACVAGGPR